MVDGLRVRRVVVGVLAWAVFALGWAEAARGGGKDAFTGTSVLLLSALTALAVTRAWQAHNRAIYRRKGPRRSSPRHDGPCVQDRLGRRLELGDGLAGASEVVISSSACAKTYRATT